MRQFRSSGSVEGVVSNHDPYSDCPPFRQEREQEMAGRDARPTAETADDRLKAYPWDRL